MTLAGGGRCDKTAHLKSLIHHIKPSGKQAEQLNLKEFKIESLKQCNKVVLVCKNTK